MQPRPRTQLPDCVGALFWDIDPGTLDESRHRDFIIGRVLSAGTLESIYWARSCYGDDELRNWIVRHQGRQLSGPQLRFWEAIIGLPSEQVDVWLAVPERQIWEGEPAA